jgi:hypothetical protein
MPALYFQITGAWGDTIDDCDLLVLRGALDFRDDDSTHWHLLRRDALGLRELGQGEGIPRGVWVSPTRRVYLVGRRDEGEGLHVGTPDEGGLRWTFHPALGSDLSGVWGLDDTLVFVWGSGVLREIQRHQPAYGSRPGPMPATLVFDGTTWRSFETPEIVHAIHGVDRGSIVAVGAHGMVARWTGSGWSAMRPPAPEVALGRVQVVGPDEMYAATFQGRLFEGSEHGWRELPSVGSHVYGMVRWKGELLVTATHDGILALENGRFVKRDGGFPRDPHAGARLLLINRGQLVETQDLKRYRRVPNAELETFMKAQVAPE